MRARVKKILESNILKDAEVIHWLPIDHRSSTVLRGMGVAIAGTDERCGPVTWGEGVTDTTLLFFVEEGLVTSLGDNVAVEARKAECLIIPAGGTKKLGIGDGILRAIWFHLQDIGQWKHLLGPIRIHRALEQASLLQPLMENLLRETFSTNLPTKLGTCMTETLAEWLIRNFGTTETTGAREMRLRLHELWQSVSSNLAYHWTAEELAGKMHVSVGHLHRIVRDLHRDHPMKIVTRMRLQKAAGFLLATEQKLDAIAEATGYQTAYALSNAFLRESGVRPGEYRRRAKRTPASPTNVIH